jgi:hypothetical protein
MVRVAGGQSRQEVAHVGGARIDRRHLSLGQEATELQQIGAVGLESVAR